jgi:glycopeptide antibiotics resistance protein
MFSYNLVKNRIYHNTNILFFVPFITLLKFNKVNFNKEKFEGGYLKVIYE